MRHVILFLSFLHHHLHWKSFVLLFTKILRESEWRWKWSRTSINLEIFFLPIVKVNRDYLPAHINMAVVVITAPDNLVERKTCSNIKCIKTWVKRKESERSGGSRYAYLHFDLFIRCMWAANSTSGKGINKNCKPSSSFHEWIFEESKDAT